MSKYFRWLVVPLSLIVLTWILMLLRRSVQVFEIAQAITFGVYFILCFLLIIYIIKLKLSPPALTICSALIVPLAVTTSQLPSARWLVSITSVWVW